MSVLDRAALEDSPLADLHAIASELSVDGYRRLRREQLIDAILGRQGSAGEELPQAEAEGREETGEGRPRRRRGRRGGRGRAGAAESADGVVELTGAETAEVSKAVAGEEPAAASEEPPAASEEPPAASEEPPAASEEPPGAGEEPAGVGEEPATAGEELAAAGGESRQEEIVEGEVELLPNGSGFLRVNPPEPSDADVYISAAQAKRCELISGDRVSGPRRAARRSERFASLIRIDAVNGQPAEELSGRPRFDELPAAFPSERLELAREEPALSALDALAPIGKGSRVTIVGDARVGKSLTLRRIAGALARQPQLHTLVVLAGVRPEETGDWSEAPTLPEQAVSFAASTDAQDQAVTSVIDQARRIAARGADAVVLLDTLDGLHPYAARRALAAARNIVDGGSLTVIATASRPLGGETTVIALDARLASGGPDPALDVLATGTLRAELLVGEEGAAAIALARGDATRV